jgi:rRNA maturation RNase YbeY
MAITFQSQEITFTLRHKVNIKAWIKQVIESEKKVLGQINFVFTSDEEVLKANVQFLKHHTYTDIITFDYCNGSLVNGDILISVERVADNAKKFKVDFENELKRVMIHGVLHLCGYKDKKPSDAKKMRQMEDLWLAAYMKL